MENKTIAKPSFRETVAITTMDLDDIGLQFNAQRVGPMNFYGFRKADYGEGFRMPTMPELVPLVYASLENQDYKSAKNVVRALRQRWLAGNTGTHYFPEGMFAEDNPVIENGRLITPSYKELESRLGSHEETGVVFSEDRTIRFTPYNFKRESQSPLDLSRNTGVIALAGGEENAEKLAKASEHWKKQPYFWVLSNVDSPQTRVAVLGLYYFDDRLDVGAYFSGVFGGSYSFGVCEKDTEGVAPEK